MSKPIEVTRLDYTALELRELASHERDGATRLGVANIRAIARSLWGGGTSDFVGAFVSALLVPAQRLLVPTQRAHGFLGVRSGDEVMPDMEAA
jgi:hypothetical protein